MTEQGSLLFDALIGVALLGIVSASLYHSQFQLFRSARGLRERTLLLRAERVAIERLKAEPTLTTVEFDACRSVTSCRLQHSLGSLRLSACSVHTACTGSSLPQRERLLTVLHSEDQSR
ncbi:MAG: hypothetical protein KDD69_11070 [Bdellovibrionales bacterium]|nr:hypothetical protein [Bdellovibrionales bacterium]